MEGKIVENKKEGRSFLSQSIPLSYLSHLSYLSIYIVCLRSTTPLWFTDKGASRPLFPYSTRAAAVEIWVVHAFLRVHVPFRRN